MLRRKSKLVILLGSHEMSIGANASHSQPYSYSTNISLLFVKDIPTFLVGPLPAAHLCTTDGIYFVLFCRRKFFVPD